MNPILTKKELLELHQLRHKLRKLVAEQAGYVYMQSPKMSNAISNTYNVSDNTASAAVKVAELRDRIEKVLDIIHQTENKIIALYDERTAHVIFLHYWKHYTWHDIKNVTGKDRQTWEARINKHLT